jgi:hypothetical protein
MKDPQAIPPVRSWAQPRPADAPVDRFWDPEGGFYLNFAQLFGFA